LIFVPALDFDGSFLILFLPDKRLKFKQLSKGGIFMDNRTTGEFLKYWLEQVIRGNVRQSTYMAYRSYIVNHLQKYIGADALEGLKVERLQGVIATLTAKGLASKTIRSIMLMLRGALNCAVDYEYIIKNPCDKVRLPRLEEKEIVVFEKSDQKRLEKTIAESGDIRDYGVLICLYTGLRIGELCGLKWDSINFSERTNDIKNSLNRVITYDGGVKKTMLVEAAPKTKKSRRIIPFLSFLCQVLKAMKKRSNSEYVISMKSGKAVEPRMMQVIYKAIESGWRRIRQFSYFASYICDAGNRSGCGCKDS
jgi:integrase